MGTYPGGELPCHPGRKSDLAQGPHDDPATRAGSTLSNRRSRRRKAEETCDDLNGKEVPEHEEYRRNHIEEER